MKLILFSILTGVIIAANAVECNYNQSVQSDFTSRDSMPQYNSPIFHDSWGPRRAQYPAPTIPDGCDPTTWQRQRIVAVAEKYIGLPYSHHHIPSYNDGNGVGLDCSNFTSWVYDYGLGIQINSAIETQSQTAGRKLDPSESLLPGDLLFIRTLDDSRISHVVIYIDPEHIIDDHGGGVKIRDFKGWYKNHFAYARRIIN